MMNSMIPFTRLNDVVDTFFAPSGRNFCAGDEAMQTPRADILESDTEFQVRMELPGVSREDIEIDLENDALKVTAKRENSEDDKFRSLRSEIPGKAILRRSFTIGRGVDRESIKAGLEAGILTITLAKSAVALPKRIEVK